MALQLIVGLGNPGSEYADTRHNVGYWLVEKLCEQFRTSLSYESKFKGSTALINIGETPCRLFEPTTFMNLSGEAVQKISHFYKISPIETLVIHDELDLLPGTARLKLDGGDGGHNGLKSVIQSLGTKQFYRLRIGIGHPGNRDQVHSYVLNRPTIAEKERIWSALNHSLDVIPDIVQGKIEKVMNKLHTVAK